MLTFTAGSTAKTWPIPSPGSTLYGVPITIGYDEEIYINLNEEEETTMEKFWTHTASSTRFKSQKEAEESAKKHMDTYTRTYGNGAANNIYIMESVAAVKVPVPEYEVVSIK